MKSSRQQLDELLVGVSRGDEAAFAELFQVTSPKLYAVALRILRSREAAEDVVQDSYFKIWERARDFNPKIAAPVTWMTAIVRNRALDEIRRRTLRPSTDVSELANIAADEEHPVEVLGRRADVERLLQCLEGLEPEKRQIVRLAYLDGLSREAIAKRFDRPEGTIKTWLRRSLAQLKGCLEQ